MRFLLATRAFFSVLSDKTKATRIANVLQGQERTNPSPTSTSSTEDAIKPAVPKSTPLPSSNQLPRTGRSEALTLLSTLQRDARLLDLVGESLDQYTDAQIGAAARDVLRDTKKSLDKMFSIRPLIELAEGEKVTVPDQPSPVRWKLVGSHSNHGTLIHSGWTASKIDLPTWMGSNEDILVLAAAEVET